MKDGGPAFGSVSEGTDDMTGTADQRDDRRDET